MKTLEEMIKEKTDIIELLQVRMNNYVRTIEKEQRALAKQVQVLKIRKAMLERPKLKDKYSEYKPVYF